MNHLFHLKEDYTPHPMRWWHLPLLLLLIGGTVWVACQNQLTDKNKTDGKEYHQTQGNVFGTLYHITYDGQKDLHEGIEATLKDVDKSLSPFNEHSVITAINNNQSDRADERLKTVFVLAQKISKVTNGAFDITCAPLVNAWGFGFKNAEKVDSTTIDSLLQFVGYKKVRLTENKIHKDDPRIMLDCSAIAKGYGVDAVAKYLEQQGVKNYMVEIGGEVRVQGLNPQRNKWRIGINKPTDDPTSTNGELQEVLEVSNIAMATSGNYRNFYEKDNIRYAHTIDPRTGYPVQHSILSATVLAADCATADAYATAFMVMGMEQAIELLVHHPEIQAYLIYSGKKGENKVWKNLDVDF